MRCENYKNYEPKELEGATIDAMFCTLSGGQLNIWSTYTGIPILEENFDVERVHINKTGVRLNIGKWFAYRMRYTDSL